MVKRTLWLKSLVVFSLVSLSSLHTKDIWVLIHGTFANKAARIIKKARWWKPRCDFYKELNAAIPKDATVEYFEWCGSNSHEKRIIAAKQLLVFLAKHVKPNDKVHLVGHSHGGNIILLASQELAKHKSKFTFASVYTLGTPVSKNYTPAMTHIKKLYNLFSYGDMIQPVLNIFGRVFDKHKNIYNIQITIDGTKPRHLQLHSPIIAHHLPKISSLIPNNKPHHISFFSDKPPVATLDINRKKDLEIDKYFILQLITSFAESKKRGHQKLADISKRTKDRILRFWNRRTLDT